MKYLWLLLLIPSCSTPLVAGIDYPAWRDTREVSTLRAYRRLSMCFEKHMNTNVGCGYADWVWDGNGVSLEDHAMMLSRAGNPK